MDKNLGDISVRRASEATHLEVTMTTNRDFKKQSRRQREFWSAF
jgi:hypothetical protein